MRIRFLLLSIVFVCFSVQAQENRPRMSKEDIMNKKWEFIIEKAALTVTDAQKIHPLFLEYENEIWSMMWKNRELFGQGRRRDQNAKIDYAAINEAFINFEVQKANSQKNYYLKLKKVVDEEVIHKMFNAERTYRQNIIQKIPGRPGPPAPRP
jgi:hypothetical protein